MYLFSGHDGGTGAAPLTSIKHAGGPWELGLAEAQQTLLLNGLRDRIVVQCDGQLKTGRDVVVAALLGAEEFGFATTALIVEGCVMMRKCHTDTCPVGVATQNPELREKFAGDPDHVVNFMMMMAEQTREILAELGFRSIDEAVGHVEALDTRKAITHWKARGLDLSPILHQVDLPHGSPLRHVRDQDHDLETSLDMKLIDMCTEALTNGTPVRQEVSIRNVDRTVGTMLGSRVTVATQGKGLPDNTIDLTFTGTAGQSFGAFVPRGMTMRLIGDANDYVGKGLSGGRVIVAPPLKTPFQPRDQIVAGNVVGYGATSGEILLCGQAGERFCVRNSGVTAVVEGVGDHGCEYMTGGEVLVLGAIGRNFAAGMSGGMAWVRNLDVSRLNADMVDALPMEQADVDRVTELLELHQTETGSTLAGEILAQGAGGIRESFMKVLPRDYATMMKAMVDAEEHGLDENETTFMEVSHG